MRCALSLIFFAAFSHALTVHIVPHTHDDVGWLKTVDQYYSGTNNTIQNAAVRNILDAVATSLAKNPQRKFTYVEQAFFQRWWRELSPAAQAETRSMVKSGQLSFVNGGWCMHDEVCNYSLSTFN
jgi:alpha-mannosidase